MTTTNKTPDSTFLRDLADRIRRLPPEHPLSEHDAEELLDFAERWDHLYSMLEALARLERTPSLNNPTMG